MDSSLPSIKSTVTSVLSEARSLIANSARPYTPRDLNRKMFLENEYSVRPSSSYQIKGLFDSNSKLAPVESFKRKKKSVEGKIQQEQRNEEIDGFIYRLQSVGTDEERCEILSELIQYFSSQKPIMDDLSRELLLTTINKLLEIENVTLLLRVSLILLNFLKEESYLLNTCKLLFKISKNDQNDSMFRQEGISKLIIPTIQNWTNQLQYKWEHLLYLVATCKNITNDTKNANYFVKHDSIFAVTHLLKEISNTFQTEKESIDKMAQLLVQVMGVLRNLSISSTALKQMRELEILQFIFPTLNLLCNHVEFMLNTSRLLSKLSLADEFSDSFSQNKLLVPLLLFILSIHKKHKAIVLRLCFILGNITFVDKSSRQQFDCNKSIPLLLFLLQFYSNEDINLYNNSNISKEMRRETEDLLSKLIRLIANLCFDTETCLFILQSEHSRQLCQILSRKSIDDQEELVINTVRCITNLSYFATIEPQNALQFPLIKNHLVDLGSQMLPLLFHDNIDVILEACKALANLSLFAEFRVWMFSSRVAETVVVLLDHQELSIVITCCGILMNLSTETEFIVPLIGNFEVVPKLITLLKLLEQQDSTDCITVVQLLYNLFLKEASLVEPYCKELAEVAEIAETGTINVEQVLNLLLEINNIYKH